MATQTAKMPAPKRPATQDHKKPAPKAVDGTYEVTVRGVKLSVPEDALDDFELLDDLGDLQNGNAARLPSVLRRLLGADQYTTALDLLRDEDTGRVRVESGQELVEEIFEALDPNS